MWKYDIFRFGHPNQIRNMTDVIVVKVRYEHNINFREILDERFNYT